jgi:hypothetical protein
LCYLLLPRGGGPASPSRLTAAREAQRLDRIHRTRGHFLRRPTPDAAELLLAAMQVSGPSDAGPEPADTDELFAVDVCEITAHISLIAAVLTPPSSAPPKCFLCENDHVLRDCPLITVTLKNQSPFARRAIGSAIRAELAEVRADPDFR